MVSRSLCAVRLSAALDVVKRQVYLMSASITPCMKATGQGYASLTLFPTWIYPNWILFLRFRLSALRASNGALRASTSNKIC